MSNASLSNPVKIGSLGETRVQDVMLEIEHSNRDARVWFETDFGMGEILFHRGRMVKARLGGARGQTALLRLLTIIDGKFGVESSSVAEAPPLIQNVSALVELHSSRKAEWDQLCSNAPPLSSVLRLTASGADVRDSSRGIQRVILVLIDGRRTLMQVLEESSFDAVEALKIVVSAIEDGLVQHAPQPSTLFPLAPAGDASGVLPRFATPPPIPRLDPTSPGSMGGPPSWRHSTLVGIGKQSFPAVDPDHELAPLPIIDLGRHSPHDAEPKSRKAPDVSSLVKTVIQGFGLGGRASSSRAMEAAGKTDGVAPHRRIIDISPGFDAEPEGKPDTDAELTSEEFPAAAAVPKPDGQRRFVDRYEILLRIGRGGMGTVYLCRFNSAEVGFRRLYALKLLRSHLIRNTDAAKDFLEEARVAGHLHHANVVAVCDAGFHGKQPYLVMDYVEGCSFKQLMRGLPSHSPYLILPIVMDALAGLQAVHTLQDESGADLRLVHCDVSPENILAGVDGNCRLTDFGIARKASRLFGATTRGKPGYVAPEQITGQAFDHRADIFSMGVVLWGALTGKRLFAGETVEETIAQVCNRPILPPSEAGAQSYRALDEIVMRALARDPTERFDSAEEMLAALGRAAMAHDGLATPKEIASWVREAAGSELTQRRLAILDASRNAPTVPPPPAEADAEIDGQADANEQTHHDLTHTVMTREILSSVENPISPPLDAHVPLERPSAKDQVADAAAASDLPCAPQSDAFDVGSLFYGKDGYAAIVPRSLSPMSVQSVSLSSGSKHRRSIRARWLLVAFVVLAVGLTLFFAMRMKSRKSATHATLAAARLATCGGTISDISTPPRRALQAFHREESLPISAPIAPSEIQMIPPSSRKLFT